MSSVELLTGALLAASKAGILVTVAAALATSLRRAPAAGRYAVWAAALAGALLLPLLTPWVPSWTVWTLPGGPATEVEEVAVNESANPVSLPAFLRERTVEAGSCAGCSASGPAAVPVATGPSAPWQTAFEGLRSLRASRAEIPAAAWLLMIWIAGVVAIVLRLGRSLVAVRQLERGAISAGSDWLGELERARDRVGVAREVRLLLDRRVRTPMTWGARRPVIVLPEVSRSWDRERRRIVLHHELSHVRRGDWLVRLLAHGVCALYWPNPLVWLARRRLVLEQERACDEAVVALGDRPSSYARHLLAIAASMARRPLTPMLALDMARRSQMEGRLMSILDGSRRSRAGRALVVPALVLIGLVPALAGIEPWGEAVEVQGGAFVPDGGVATTNSMPEPAEVGNSQNFGGLTPGVDTGNLARALGELERLEAEMEPFERELEAIEAEMEPIEAELEGVEDRLEPFERELEAREARLEPHEVNLEAIEAELEPYEDRLEALEAELEPYEARLDALEGELEPYADRLESLEAELEPFEGRLEAMEGELEPGEDRLDAIESELDPYEDRLESIEAELEPFEDQLAALEERMEPFEDELDLLSERYDRSDSVRERERLRDEMSEVRQKLEPFHEKMRSVHESMRPVHERMQAIHEEMRPVHEQMRAVHDEMRPVHERTRAIHEEMAPVHERMRAVHEEMRPVHERMRAVHEEMRPVHERARAIHEEMRPVYERMRGIYEDMEPAHDEMREIHERMRPVHEVMGAHHERMEPYHRKMSELHERMKPLHQEMAVHHRVVEQELVVVVREMLAAHLGPSLPPGTDFSGAAGELVHRSAVRIRDGRLRLLSSGASVRTFLGERFASSAGEPAFEAALAGFLESYSHLEIAAR